jgi:hypothetical protein
VKPAVAPVLLAALLAGCVAAPSPQWQADAQIALDRFSQSWLEGNTRIAEHYFTEARSAVAGTGRPELAARVELIRCALGTAALDFEACSRYESVQADATAGDRAYAAFLGGRLVELEASKLPPQYAPVARARDEVARNKAMQAIEDPLSRLIAAGALFRGGSLSPQGLSAAADAASAQAWRRPLLAYLGVQAKLAETAGDTAALEALRRRIEIVTQAAGQRD